MSRQTRPRRETARCAITLLAPVLRFSASPDAYVLRLVGNRRGPVLRARRETQLR